MRDRVIGGRNGTVALIRRGNLVVHRNLIERTIARWDAPAVTGPADISHDGSKVATLVRTTRSVTENSNGLETKPPEALVVADLDTGVSSRFPMPHNGTVLWSADDRHVLVGLPSGFIALDPSTGERGVVDLPGVLPFGQLLFADVLP